MGKNQHAKDTLHVRPSEHAEDGTGYKKAKFSPFKKLPINCCALTQAPFESPVGTRDGHIFEATNIISHLKRHKNINPCSGARLTVSDLIPLHFHLNAEGEFCCPVTHKDIGTHSHVVMIATSGHVYLREAIDELNLRPKNMVCLMSSKPFKKADIVTIQEPSNPANRLVENFFYVKMGLQEQITNELRPDVDEEEKKQRIRGNAAMDRVYQLKEERMEKGEMYVQRTDKSDPSDVAAQLYVKTPEELAKEEAGVKKRRMHGEHTTGAAAQSFTSSRVAFTRTNEMREMTAEEERELVYAHVRKTHKKAYVRVMTSAGNLNFELHADVAPLAVDNFLMHCESGYYHGTIFHRLIRNFMMQGGDPTGTGKGGKSAFPNGSAFKDEIDARLSHSGPGVVSMANAGRNSNRSQFFVTFKSCEHLDGLHTIFGRCVGGLNVLKECNDVETWEKEELVKNEKRTESLTEDRPKVNITIVRTEVFKDPFKEAEKEMEEAEKAKNEEEVKKKKEQDAEAMWFSNMMDPMEKHEKRGSTSIGKYLLLDEPKEKKKQQEKVDVTEEELEYATVPERKKVKRTSFDFSEIKF